MDNKVMFSPSSYNSDSMPEESHPLIADQVQLQYNYKDRSKRDGAK